MIRRAIRMGRSDAALATSSNAARSLGRLAATVVLARTSGIEAIGLLTILVAAEAILISTVGALFASPAAVLSPGRRKRLRDAIHAEAERLQAATGVILALGAGVGALAAGMSPSLALIIVVYLAVATVYQGRRSTRIAEFSSGRVLAAELLIASLGVTLFLAATVIGLDAIEAFWGAQAVGHAVGVVLLPGVRRTSARDGRVTRIVRGSLVTTGRAMVIGSLANSVSGRSQAFLISLILGRSAVGAFGAASTFAAPLRMLSGAIRGVLLPRFAQRRRLGKHDAGSWRALLTVLVGIAGAGCVASVLAPLAMSAVYGPEFARAAPLIPLCVVLALVGMATTTAACIGQAAGRSAQVARVRVCCALASPALLAAGAALDGLAAGLAGCILAETACLFALWRNNGTSHERAPRIARKAGALARWTPGLGVRSASGPRPIVRHAHLIVSRLTSRRMQPCRQP